MRAVKNCCYMKVTNDKYNYCPTCGARMDEVKEKE